jgi:glutamyl/glutaminyl-tRNA synthetase
MAGYRGRLAPTPSGHLHIGHARTFWIAHLRARQFDGKLILRIEDLDRQRCKTPYVDDLIEDLEWIGIQIDEGPHISGGAFGRKDIIL